MRELIKTAQKKSAVISHKAINDAVLRFLKEGIEDEIKRHIENGATIKPRADVLGSCAEIYTIEIAPFDAGFDLEASYAKRIIMGVREGGNAYRAGMRNGQKLVGIDLVRDPTVLATFTIEEAGMRKSIKYFPAGDNKTVAPQFRLKPGETQKDDYVCRSWFNALPQAK